MRGHRWGSRAASMGWTAVAARRGRARRGASGDRHRERALDVRPSHPQKVIGIGRTAADQHWRRAGPSQPDAK
ncbi:MAG: hypothetical protein IPF99_32465 [Deltaproteobacteria bacterium]|nr:hypothetical protein [Deltaproteobacteria bacterium]